MHRGFVKFWRKATDSGMSCVLLGLWAHCLLEAAHRRHVTYVAGQAVELLPGQFIFGRGAWSSRLGLSEKVLRNLIGTLQKRAMIQASKRASTYTVFEIVNWGIYQSSHEDEGQQIGQRLGQQLGQHGASSGPHPKNVENAFQYTGPPEVGAPGHVEADKGNPDPAPPAKPNAEPKDPRPAGCPPEVWERYLRISHGYHRARAEQLGRQAPYAESKVFEGAKTLDTLIRARGCPEDEVISVLGWASEDAFWSSNLRSIGALLKKSSNNGELKYTNVLASMTRDLERKRAQEASHG